MAAALEVTRQAFAAPPWQLFRSSTCCTAVIVLTEGIVTLTIIPQLTGSKNLEWRSAKLDSFLPLFAACLQQWLATQRAITRTRSFDQALGYSGTATILLGHNGEILHANAAAEIILAERDGLRRLGERLTCATFTDTLRLQAALSHFHAKLEAGSETTPVLAVPRVNRRPLVMALAAIRSESGTVTDEVWSIAYVFDPEQNVSELIAPVCRLHGLSHSETKLACALVAGESLGMAAQSLGVQEQTARTYLKHIFEKTETNRQAQLVQLMLKGAVRLDSGLKIQAFM
jgi:DNA-binding CsgD family transcriptional regulator